MKKDKSLVPAEKKRKSEPAESGKKTAHNHIVTAREMILES